MSDLVGVVLTLPINQSNQTNVNDATLCGQVDTWSHVSFIVFYSLVFLVSLKYSGSLLLCLRKH